MFETNKEGLKKSLELHCKSIRLEKLLQLRKIKTRSGNSESFTQMVVDVNAD